MGAASWPYPRLIAHRGGGSAAPENTLAGLRAGRAAGFHGVEFDVMLSADGTPHLIHDDTLERTTNGHGPVCAASDQQLARLDAGAWHSPMFTGEGVPTLEAAGCLCRELGLWANVEIKPYPGTEAETGRRAAALAADLWRGVALPPLLSSFSPEALLAARDVAPNLPRALLELAAAIQAAGYGLACYTANEADRVRALWAMGVDGVFTDRLDFQGLAPVA
jgi:glycerophosphoryl diester phosphodiesterase